MYEPPHFVETRPEVLYDLIRAHPLGLLISAGPEAPTADAVPFLLDVRGEGSLRLLAHVARANAHWRVLAERPEREVLIVFQGAEAYITPSWYQTKRETGKVVPTWNYAMVQVRGRATIHDDAAWIASQVATLTRTHEDRREKPWHVTDAPEPFIAAQLRAIVGIEITVTAIEGKWKVSQNRPVADRVGVAEGLGDGNLEMAGLVRRHGGLDDG